jgi:nitrite reductase/ring-hydroxylating ferredoxin subunit
VAWHEVGAAGEEPAGTLRRVDVGERAVCLARTDDGWLAFDDTCTHEECSLAEGELDGEVVICPCHGSEFDIRTGDVVTPPALDPLPIYEAREDGGTLFVRLAAPAFDDGAQAPAAASTGGADSTAAGAARRTNSVPASSRAS